jgi:hypothetical protein
MNTDDILEDVELDAVVGGGKGKVILAAAGAAAVAVGLDLAASAIWDGIKSLFD